mmetsp:Transcript_91635/g.258735  ORF Transcript_91635/g.258735 Transcript_91635/m.258735 type:complete len:244 (-) Transcript_91635:220-951(-)
MAAAAPPRCRRLAAATTGGFFCYVASKFLSSPRPQRQRQSLAASLLPAPLQGLAVAGALERFRALPTAMAATAALCEECDAAFIHEEDFTPQMRDIVTRVDFLTLLEEASFVLDGVAPHIIEKLVALAGQKVFAAKGQCLIKQGVANTKIIILGQGHLSIHVDGQHVAYVVPGQMIGERAFVLKENAIADAVVLSDLAYFLVLEHANVLDILGEDPEVLGRMKILVREREFQLKAQAITAKKA